MLYCEGVFSDTLLTNSVGSSPGTLPFYGLGNIPFIGTPTTYYLNEVLTNNWSSARMVYGNIGPTFTSNSSTKHNRILFPFDGTVSGSAPVGKYLIVITTSASVEDLGYPPVFPTIQASGCVLNSYFNGPADKTMSCVNSYTNYNPDVNNNDGICETTCLISVEIQNLTAQAHVEFYADGYWQQATTSSTRGAWKIIQTPVFVP